MPDTTPDVAKAHAWDLLMQQLELLGNVDRDASLREIAGYFHVALDASARHKSIPAPVQGLLRDFADQLGGIATVPDALKTILREALKDNWSGPADPM